MEFHEVANIFPLMDGEPFMELCTDIASNGLLEPIWTWKEKIIDGRNRFRACKEIGIEPFYREWKGEENGLLTFVLSMNLKRRHLSDDQLATLGVVVKEWEAKLAKERQIRKPADSVQAMRPEQKGQSRDKAGKKVGVSGKKVDRAENLKKKNERLFEQVAAGTLTLKDAEKEVDNVRRFEQHAELVKLAEKVKPSDRWKVFVGDIQSKHLPMPYENIDAIITDPPYPREYLPLWSNLATFAKKYLKPGGVLLAMTPAPYLPEVMAMLGEHLTYQWIMACVLPGSHGSVIKSGVRNVLWKPILVYRNGGDPVNIGSDLFENDKRDKDFHEWGQGVGGYLWQVENFTKPNDLVCDPFLGGGTTALAALQLKRRFIGFDRDADKVSITKGRLSNVIIP